MQVGHDKPPLHIEGGEVYRSVVVGLRLCQPRCAEAVGRRAVAVMFSNHFPISTAMRPAPMPHRAPCLFNRDCRMLLVDQLRKREGRHKPVLLRVLPVQLVSPLTASRISS